MAKRWLASTDYDYDVDGDENYWYEGYIYRMENGKESARISIEDWADAEMVVSALNRIEELEALLNRIESRSDLYDRQFLIDKIYKIVFES